MIKSMYYDSGNIPKSTAPASGASHVSDLGLLRRPCSTISDVMTMCNFPGPPDYDDELMPSASLLRSYAAILPTSHFIHVAVVLSSLTSSQQLTEAVWNIQEPMH